MTLALPRAELTETSLAMPADATYEEWADQGARLFTMERAVMWWIGDWWRFGEHRYGERAAQALNSHYSYQTLADAGWVASRIEPSDRSEVLTWTHHRAVAPLEPDDRRYWIAEAERGEWTVSELRARIKRGTDSDEGIEPAVQGTAHWDDLAGLMDSLEAFLSSDASDIAAAVPPRRRAATARRLRKLGTGLGRIAWTLEGMEEPQ